jgi:hypothetical protein
MDTNFHAEKAKIQTFSAFPYPLDISWEIFGFVTEHQGARMVNFTEASLYS